MICLICQTAIVVDGLTSVMLERGEFRLMVRGVPARICPGCGEAYVEGAVAEQLLDTARQRLADGILDAQCEFGIP